MNQQPDKLFRDKLANYQKPVPTSAWDRIAAANGKTKSNKGWLRIAASLLLLAGAGATWVLLSQNNSSTSSALTDNTVVREVVTPETGTNPSASENAEAATPVPDPAPGNEATGAHLAIAGQSHIGASKTLPKNKRHATAEAQTAAASKEPALINKEVGSQNQSRTTDQTAVVRDDNDMTIRNSEVIAESYSIASPDNTPPNPEIKIAENVTEVSVMSREATGVTLVYSAEDVSVYLNKNPDDEATVDDKKQSTLKKLLQKANDLTTNQDPVGELRQRKNEILALNFKNDKREQKMRN